MKSKINNERDLSISMQSYEHKIYEEENKNREGEKEYKKVRMTLAFVIVRRLLSGQGNFSSKAVRRFGAGSE
jgi:hypothetical protein